MRFVVCSLVAALLGACGGGSTGNGGSGSGGGDDAGSPVNPVSDAGSGTTPDSGTAGDAGDVPDAGPQDGGAPDAGGGPDRDAGTPDAGRLAYDLLDLGPALVNGINEQGQVAGTVGPVGKPGVPSVFTPGKGWSAVPTPDGATFFVPAGIDSHGTVGLNAGFTFQRSSYFRAYTTPPLRAIPTNASPGESSALSAVNPATGHLVGSDAVFGAFLFANGSMTSIAGQPGSSSSIMPSGLNAKDQVVGRMHVSSEGVADREHAFLWDRGTLTDLGGGKFPFCGRQAVGINDAGLVVGMIDLGARCGEPAVFLWDGETHVVGCPKGLTTCQPFAVNARGEVVGHGLATVLLPEEGFIYRNGGFLLLKDLVDAPGWHLESPVGINDSGQIAGFGTFNGEQRGFLLTPRH